MLGGGLGGSLDMVPLNLGAELSRLLDVPAVPAEDERRFLRDPLLELRRLNGVDGCVGCSRHPSPPTQSGMLAFKNKFNAGFSISM